MQPCPAVKRHGIGVYVGRAGVCSVDHSIASSNTYYQSLRTYVGHARSLQ